MATVPPRILFRLIRALLCAVLAVSILCQSFSHVADAAAGRDHVSLALTADDGPGDGAGTPQPDAVPDCAAHGCSSLPPRHADAAAVEGRGALALIVPAVMRGTRTVLPDKPPRR